MFSAAALALSVWNFWRAHVADKRNMFLRMHETLIEPDVVKGRRALYNITSRDAAHTSCDDEEETTRIYRALALWDVMGLYVESGWVKRDTVLKEWSTSLVRSKGPAELWMAERYQDVQWHEWPHYKDLVDAAARVEKGRRLLKQNGAPQG